MPRRTPNPDTWIDDIRHAIREIELLHEPWVECMTDLAPGHYPQQGENTSTISTTAVVDPTASNAASREWLDRQWQEWHADLAEARGLLVRSRRRMIARLGAASVDAIRASRRCDGSKLAGWKIPRPQGWADHHCNRLAKTHRGLCEACDQRFRRWERRAA